VAEGGRVEALGDAEESAVAEDEFQGWRGGRLRVVADIGGNERERFVGGSIRGRPLAKASPPGVEGGFGQTVATAEIAHGQAAVLPAVEELSPALFLAGITGFTLWHEQDLQDTVKEDHVLKITTVARMGATGRLLATRERQVV
jgi:hypothetical protein